MKRRRESRDILVGSLVAGWLSDRVWAARRAPVCVIFMLATTASIVGFWRMPEGHPAVDFALLLSIGFFIYGPQFLVGVMVTDQASKAFDGMMVFQPIQNAKMPR